MHPTKSTNKEQLIAYRLLSLAMNFDLQYNQIMLNFGMVSRSIWMNLKECFDTILQLLWLIPSILQHAIQNTQKVFFPHLIVYWSRGSFVQLAINLNLLSVSIIMVSCKICKVGTTWAVLKIYYNAQAYAHQFMKATLVMFVINLE